MSRNLFHALCWNFEALFSPFFPSPRSSIFTSMFIFCYRREHCSQLKVCQIPRRHPCSVPVGPVASLATIQLGSCVERLWRVRAAGLEVEYFPRSTPDQLGRTETSRSSSRRYDLVSSHRHGDERIYSYVRTRVIPLSLLYHYCMCPLRKNPARSTWDLLRNTNRQQTTKKAHIIGNSFRHS